MNVFEKPDFIGIGQMKAGTGWLYDQLRSHQDVWMPPSKELHFFNNGFRFSSTLDCFSQLAAKNLTELDHSHWEQPSDPPWHEQIKSAAQKNVQSLDRLKSDFEFYRRALLTKDARREYKRFLMAPRQPNQKRTQNSLEWYSHLFSHETKITGDITPGYQILNKDQVQQILNRFPRTKFVLIVRPPVERAISHINQLVRRNVVEATDSVVSISAFEKKKEHLQTVLLKSSLSKIQKTWIQNTPEEKILVENFRALETKPLSFRNRISSFLEIDPDGYHIPCETNQKAVLQKFRIAKDLLEHISNSLSDETKLYEEIFDCA